VPSVASFSTWWAWLALGLFPTALNFQIMYWMLPRIGPTNFAANTYVAPVVALLLGWIVLGEILLPAQALGMLIVVLGLLVMDGRLVAFAARLRRAPVEHFSSAGEEIPTGSPPEARLASRQHNRFERS
jgi:uncharacterized membrane protein (DUF4010 family)